MTAATVWRAPVPSDILPLLAAVTVGGSVAGFLAATPVLFITSPLVAAVLAAAAVFGRRTPEWNPVAVEALAHLPDGQARTLLVDLLRRADAVPRAAQPDGRGRRSSPQRNEREAWRGGSSLAESSWGAVSPPRS